MAQSDEPLLGAVVQVALDPFPFVVGRLQDPCLRGTHLPYRGAQLDLEPMVLEHEAGSQRGSCAAQSLPSAIASDAEWRSCAAPSTA